MASPSRYIPLVIRAAGSTLAYSISRPALGTLSAFATGHGCKLL